MSNLVLEPVATNAPFSRIVEAANWSDPEIPKAIQVAPALGWLVVTGVNGEAEGLVGFSAETTTDAAAHLPPANLAEVKQRLGSTTAGWLNTDMTAKGLGSVLANTPYALQPSSLRKPQVAVRSVPFTSLSELYSRQEADTLLDQSIRLIRHGVLLALSSLVDGLTSSGTGTLKAMRYMERPYCDARLVRMPAPPSWQLQQRGSGVVHNIAPQIVLARGGRFTHSNPMTEIGSFPL